MPYTVEKNDYIVIKDKDDKDNGNLKGKLVRVTSVKQGYKGVLIDKNYGKDGASDKIDFEPSQILIDLGPEPKSGTVYGCKVEILHDTMEVKHGVIHFWRKLTDEEKQRVAKVINTVNRRFVDDGLTLGKAIEYTVREPGGKMVGYYKHTGKLDVADELCLKPKSLSKALLPNEELEQLYCHEAAHGLWFTRMSLERQAKWIKAYSRNVTLSKINSEALERYRSELADTKSIKRYVKSLDETQTKEFKEILKWLRKQHVLEPRHINALLTNNDDLKDYWPKNALALQRKNIIVSDYALSKPDEFFAESFCFHYTKAKNLPKSIRKLMNNTLAELKREAS